MTHSSLVTHICDRFPAIHMVSQGVSTETACELNELMWNKLLGYSSVANSSSVAYQRMSPLPYAIPKHVNGGPNYTKMT